MQAVSGTTLKKQPMVLGKSMPNVLKDMFFADEHMYPSFLVLIDNISGNCCPCLKGYGRFLLGIKQYLIFVKCFSIYVIFTVVPLTWCLRALCVRCNEQYCPQFKGEKTETHCEVVCLRSNRKRLNCYGKQGC